MQGSDEGFEERPLTSEEWDSIQERFAKGARTGQLLALLRRSNPLPLAGVSGNLYVQLVADINRVITWDTPAYKVVYRRDGFRRGRAFNPRLVLLCWKAK